MRTITRRTFLKFSSLGTLGLALPQTVPPTPGPDDHLGRVTSASEFFDQPTFSARRLGLYSVNTVLAIRDEQMTETPTAPHNLVWFRTDEGWVHSAFVQPVKNELNKPLAEVPGDGFLAEVTVPMTTAWRNDDGRPQRAYYFYYASTHWVTRHVTDKKGLTWYRVLDDRYQVDYFVLAEHLRQVPPEELTPLAATVRDKHLEVSLAEQNVTAYENGRAVFRRRVSTGRAIAPTPVGQFRVERKRPSRHMAATDGNGFDLPGVPWVAYISWTGVAFHGTYWHNDYGRPRSRGCINLLPEDAKWLYRWTLPIVPPDEQYTRDPMGTRAVVS